MLTNRMAMRRMNEMRRRMALTLVFYVLLFHNCLGQNATTMEINQIFVTSEPMSTQMTPGGPTTTNLTNSPATEVNQVTDNSSTITQDALPGSTGLMTDTAVTMEQTQESLVTSEATTSQPVVNNIEGDLSKSSESHSANHTENVNQVNQVGQELGVQKRSPAQSEKTAVFVPLLVSGLILAAALIGVYVWKNHSRTKANSMKLAEESYMADEDNQGNTLMSVAPLNPPESQEKPSQNGESLEGVKTQNPPAATNGHSTTKADTEL